MKARDLFPLGQKIARTLKGAADHYATLSHVSPDARRPAVVLWVESYLADWNPQVAGISVLDGLSRAAAAEFLGGVAFTFCSNMKNQDAA